MDELGIPKEQQINSAYFYSNSQKPTEWNEEDEKMRTKCAACLGCNYHGGLMSRDEYNEAHNWLNSLKDRVPSHLNQEWGEEDKEIMDNLLQHLKVAYSDCEWLKQTTNWLKSIKNRYTWMPNDDQMEALLYEVNAWDEYSINGQNLKSLYQDLKELKGE